MTALVTMSPKEIDRASVLAQVTEGRLTQVHPAEILGLSVRPVRRLCRRYEAHGVSGLASKQRGRPSNRRAVWQSLPTFLECSCERYQGVYGLEFT